jgi:predicted O-methyltransferase YrrM
MTNLYRYTNDWFCRNINISMKLLQTLYNVDNELHILEIGTHEGRSAIWMLDNLCYHTNSTFTSIDPYLAEDVTSPVSNQTYENFLHNISLCLNKTKFIQYKDLSCNILPTLLEEKRLYDIIYIDGSHLMEDVLYDLKMSDSLLKSGGVILLDDIGYEKKDAGPFGAVTKFLNENSSYKVILQEYQWMIQKTIQ